MIDIINAIRGISTKIQNLAAPQYDGVFFDSFNGVAGTGANVGTPQNPSNNMADAQTIAAARKLLTIYLVNPQDSFTLTAALKGFRVVGTNTNKDAMPGIDFGGQDISNSVFVNLVCEGICVSGLYSNGASFYNCNTNVVYSGTVRMYNCFIYDLTAGVGAIHAYLYDCYSDETNNAILSIAHGSIDVVAWRGYVIIEGLNGGGYNTFYATDGAQIYLDSTNTGAMIELTGDYLLNNSVAGTTVLDEGSWRKGKENFFTTHVTSAANAGAVVLATATQQPSEIESVVIRSNGATTADLTSAAITFDNGQNTAISAATATQANLNATGKQVSGSDSFYLPTGTTMVMTLVGTGATPVDFTVVIKYRTLLDYGYLA